MDYDTMKVLQLRNLCSKYSLKKSGNKKELINRIKEYKLVIEMKKQQNYENYKNDISKENDVYKNYESSSLKKWIKLISTDETILFEDYNRKNVFNKVADIVLDNDMSVKGIKIRNTLIKFVPTIPEEDFNKDCEWIYLLVINGMIIKIGGTRTGLKGRISSYLCGHHIKERGKSGDCSKTNGFIYNTFEFYLKHGCKIEMFGYELPRREITVEIFDKLLVINAQTYHAYESTYLVDYKKTYGKYPILSDNCDPDYK